MKDSIFEGVTDIQIGKSPKPRNLENELFGKKDPNKIVDAIEREMGYPQKQDNSEYVYKHRIFSPSHSIDEKLLNALMNDKDKFQIIMWKDTWTVHGDFKIFVIYAEKQGVKKETTEESTDE